MHLNQSAADGNAKILEARQLLTDTQKAQKSMI
jgi:hypothetical protein